MSVYKLPYLYCDGPGCLRGDGGQSDTPFIIDPLPGDTAASVREQAKGQGWKYRGGKDYCPVCIETMAAIRGGGAT